MMSLLTIAFVILLCIHNAVPEGLPYKNTCVAARESYKHTHAAVDFNLIDPVFHYTHTKQVINDWPLSLCDPPALYPDNSACNCSVARDIFTSNYPQIQTNDPFTYWVNNYLSTGLVWHCEKCTAYAHFFSSIEVQSKRDTTGGERYHALRNDTSTTGSSTTGSGTPSPVQVPASQRCLAAILDFWVRTPESRNNHPVYFFESKMLEDPSLGYTWNGALCNRSPVYMADADCQCTAARQQYVATYTNAELPSYNGNPFNHFIQFENTNGPAWHCELCPGTVEKLPEVPQYLGTVSACIAARQWYSDKHPSLLDPVYFFQTYGINSTASQWPYSLCDATSKQIDDPSCATCADTIANYKTVHPDAGFYNDPFLHYWNNYLRTGFMWDCTSCVPEISFNSTPTTPPPVVRPTPRPFVNDASCTCLAARHDYFNRYPEIEVERVDPVYHYVRYGGGNTWNCELCDKAPQQLTEATCNCPAAANQYLVDNGLSSGTDAWASWKASGEVHTWHCELCTIPDVLPVQDSCNCLAARTIYNYSYPEIFEFSPVDPYYYHRWFGYKEGKTWNCDVCTDPKAHFPTEHVCNCPEGKAVFQQTYRSLSGYSQYANPFDYWASKFNYYGNSWSCLSCNTRIANPAASLTCNCTGARSAYLERYVSVTGDPWTHYISNPRNIWDCEVCNDTCVGEVPSVNIGGSRAVSWGYPGQVIPRDSTVYLLPGCFIPLDERVNVNAGDIHIYGVARCPFSSAAKANITARKIFVFGSLECGSSERAFTGTLNITLIGVPSADTEIAANSTGGLKSLVVLENGLLSLHGAKTTSWTRLSETANVDDQIIRVSDPVDWQLGDRIVIVTTDIYYNATSHSEEVDVVAVSGNSIIISEPLKYMHHGVTQTTTGTGLQLRRYAEVGLISATRNIIISGDDSSARSGYGAQVVVLSTGRAYISGIVVNNGGQRGVAYRYPVQWYANNIAGQYFIRSSITNSYNRGLVSTASKSLTISHNICYKIVGHNFVLDTGLEDGHVFEANLVLKALSPIYSANYYSPEDVLSGVSGGNGPAGFFVRNPNNTFINNVVADSVGTAFWFKPDYSRVWPGITRFMTLTDAVYGTFDGNVIHSMYKGFVNCPETNPQEHYNTHAVTSLTIYSVEQGFYSCIRSVTASGMVIAEARGGVESVLKTNIVSSALINYFSTPVFLSAAAVVIGVGDLIISNSAIINYNGNSSVYRPQRGQGFSTGLRLANTRFINSTNLLTDPELTMNVSSYAGEWGSVISDTTGDSLQRIMTVVANHPMMIDDRCVPFNEVYSCNIRFATIRLSFGSVMIPPTKVVKHPFDGTTIPNAVDTSAQFTTLFTTPSSLELRFAAAANTRYIYQIVLPVVDTLLFSMELRYSAYENDYVLLQLYNVASFSLSGVALDSCASVFNYAGFSYYFNRATSMACVRISALNRSIADAQDDRAFGFTGVTFGTMGKDYSLQPAKPYSDLPFSVVAEDQCIGAIVDYWTRYPEVEALDIDPAYHYQAYGRTGLYSWNARPCLEDPHYISESYCACPEAKERYTMNRTIPLGADPYVHYSLYQLYLGYGYHCELCTYVPPTLAPTPTASGNVDNSTKPIDIRGYDSHLAAGLGAFTAIGVLIAFVCAFFLAVYWQAFKKHGPLYCSLIVFGALLSYAAVFVLLPRPARPLCLAFPWFLGIAFSLVYGCLFIKTWALYQVWRNAKNFQRTTLTPAYILKGILLYCSVEVIYLIIWFVIDAPTVQLEELIDGSYQQTCKSKHVTFWIVFIAVKAIWLVFGAVLSFLTRNMVKEYNESKSIAYAIYNIVLLGVIGGPVVAYVQSAGVPGAVLVVEVVLIVLAFTFTLIALFGGLIYEIIHPSKDDIGAKLSTLAQKKSEGSQGSVNSRSSSNGFSDEPRTSFDRSGVTHSGKMQEVYLA